MAEATRIAIIGGGFSGAMTALHIIRSSKMPLAISIFESRQTIGLGLAYSTVCPGTFAQCTGGRDECLRRRH